MPKPNPDLSAVPHGLLPCGTETPHGVVLGRSDTAYLVARVEGAHRVERYVSFVAVHGPYRPATPLVVFS